MPIRISTAPAKFNPEIAAFRPAQLRERSPESRDLRLSSRIALQKAHLNTDQPHPVRLLRACRKRPSRCGASKQRDELASLKLTELHSILHSRQCAGYPFGEDQSVGIGLI